ncbi:MAG: hypothetical protein AVDCRST_MAG39-2191 [uncultured Sphingomonadaceae bacterium]|uniref:Tryptophan halogenase n=1 Tax=uncultured Sphingomonadaceae bacterium TaxID=169976 RepID=A0A6J4T5A6_9SPHN|nr:MAG: hypothetical protein AVDCRST_MAG39-2191 [uncultured Sphingomonadaceae bacterium]
MARASVRSFDYALHLDIGLYAGLLREFAEARGATRTTGRTADVALAPASGMASVRLASGEVVAGDLFVDCTAHRALLIGEAMASPSEDCAHWLPCDGVDGTRGRAARAPHPGRRGRGRVAVAHPAVPLHRPRLCLRQPLPRQGRGAAAAAGRVGRPPDAAPRLTRFRPGRRLRAWQGNGVAIGAAGSFVELLEASGLHLVQAAIINLLIFFFDKRVDPALPTEFNRSINAEFDRVRDLLILRYRLNGRDDGALWRHCHEEETPDGLRASLDLFAHDGSLAAGDDGPFAPRH